MRISISKEFVVSALLVILFAPLSAFADTLFFSPTSGSYNVGQTFPVRILVSSTQRAINAASGVLSFPADKLQVTSVSKVGSILSLWVQEPSFSNSQGTVSFEGVVPNPGFNRQDGRIITVNFRATNTGNASLRFSSGSLLANDGYGTNILRTLGTAAFSINSAQAEQASPPVEEVPFVEPDIESPETTEPAYQTPPLSVPSVESVWNLLLKFLSIIIPIIALIFLLIHTTKRGVDSVQKLRGVVRKDLHNIDRLVEKSFDILKEDISESIDILERARVKRKLTAEENAITHRLRQNLVDAEKIIHREVVSAEKDIGD